MGTYRGEQRTRPRRWRAPGLTPIELWDLEVPGGLLWEKPGALLGALMDLRAGTAVSRSRGPVLEIARDFDAVFLSGRGSADPLIRESLARAPFAVVFSEEPVFGGEEGGLALLRAQGLEGMVADLGQSRLKLSFRGRRAAFARDQLRLPITESKDSVADSQQRRALREFLGQSLGGFWRSCGARPQGLVMGLPCFIHDDGNLGGSTYAAMKGDIGLVGDALELAGLAGLPAYLLNDAELAALTAARAPALAGSAKSLILTLGFGVGAAVLEGKR